MKNDPEGIQGLINKMMGLSRVFKDKTLADSTGMDQNDLSLDAIREYIATKVNDTADIFVRCEEALNRISLLDFSKPIEVDDSNTAGNYVAHSLNVLMEELSSNVFPFHNEILDKISDLVAVTNPRGQIQKVNKRFITLTGYSQKDLKGKDIRELFSPSLIEVDLEKKFSMEDVDITLTGKRKIVPVTLSIAEMRTPDNTICGFTFIAQTKFFDK